MGVKEKEAAELLLSEEKIETVSSADTADTFKPQQRHWKCIRGVMAVFTVGWLHLPEWKLFMMDLWIMHALKTWQKSKLLNDTLPPARQNDWMLYFNKCYFTLKHCQQNDWSYVVRQTKRKKLIYFHRITHLVLRNLSENILCNPWRVSSLEQPSEEVLLD